MGILKGFWGFLNDVREIPWGEVAEQGIEAVTATSELGEAIREQSSNLKQFQPYLDCVEPFLDRRGKRFALDEATVNWQVYDLLGYGGLSEEIVEYLFKLLDESESECTRGVESAPE